jgi:hypothetical protein
LPNGEISFQLEGTKSHLQLLKVNPHTGDISLQPNFWNQIQRYSTGIKINGDILKALNFERKKHYTLAKSLKCNSFYLHHSQ